MSNSEPVNNAFEIISPSTPLLESDRESDLSFETEIDKNNQHIPKNAPKYQSHSPHGPQALPLELEEKPHRTPKFIFMLTFLSAIGGFLFGYDTGVVSGAMIFLREVFHLNSLWQELVVSITIGTAAIFALVGGFLNDRFGRKPTILVSSVVFAVGAIVLGVAVNREMLLSGRVIVGIGIGLSSTTIPMYIAESAPAHLRGRLVTLNNAFICGGQMIAGLVDGAFSYDKKNGWRYMLGLAAIPAVVQFIGFFFMPESPRYLVKKDKDGEARHVLQRMRGVSDVELELSNIRITIDENKELTKGDASTLWRMLTTPHVRKALLVGCGLQLFQQLCGINTVMYYSATIVKMSGVRDESDAIWLAALTAVANFMFTFVGLYLVDKIGRRPLTIGSLSGTAASLAVLAIGFQLAAFRSPNISMVEVSPRNITQEIPCADYSSCNSCMMDTYCGFCYEETESSPANGSCLPAFQNVYGEPYDNSSMYGRCSTPDVNENDIFWAYEYCPTNIAWMATFGMILYLACFAPGMGPMPWTINSEIYPMWARSTGNSISTMVNWTSNLLIAMTFLTLTETLTRYGAFWLYTGFSLCGIIFLSLLLPETKGKSLEEVEQQFMKPFCSHS